MLHSSHYLCLDVLHVDFESLGKPARDCAILLEIWDRGGLLQTSKPVAEGSILDIKSASGSVKATVNSCEGDDYGFVMEIAVESSASWFPEGYCPPYLKPSEAA